MYEQMYLCLGGIENPQFNADSNEIEVTITVRTDKCPALRPNRRFRSYQK
jgi:hypothetical protein